MAIALPQSIITLAAVNNESYINDVNSGYEYTEHDCGHDHSQVEYDLLEGYTGPGYSVEEIYLQQLGLIQPMNATVSNANTCNSITSSHGAGRQNGFATNFLSTGCSNWRGYSYTYGATNIPFFISTTGMSTALIDDIRAQVEMWNQTVMHDGTGQIVNIYEVNHTNNINGRPVVIVSRSTTLGSGVAGLFTGSPTAPTVQVAASMNVDTPVHEFGHLLGLNDIDPASGSTSGTHHVLMGYSRGTTTSTLSSAIKYQDIQGIARVNGRHTTHQFSRFVMNGSRYIHFCFYCDTVDDRASALSGSAAMATASSCTHTYQQMVSQGSRHWLKCTKCYKVTESDRIMVQGLTSTTLKVTGAIGTISGSFAIPSALDGQSITQIGASAFANQTQLSQISIPSTITSIRDQAFANCTGLTKITIPSSVTYVSQKAFLGCSNLTIEVMQWSSSGWSSTWNPNGRPVLYMPAVGCSHSFTLQGCNPTNHTYKCTICNCIKEEAGGSVITYLKINSTNHTRSCSLCGHSATEAHTLEYTWNSERCIYCLYLYTAPPGQGIWSLPIEANSLSLNHHCE